MLKTDFLNLNHFKYDEKTYKGIRLFHNMQILANTDYFSMKHLDEISDLVERPCILHCTFDPSSTGHSHSNSWHYKRVGTAIDGHYTSNGKADYFDTMHKVLSIIEMLGMSNKVGFGIYPQWSHPGFHIDFRNTKARWGAKYVIVKNEETGKKEHKQIYVSLEDAFKL